MQNARTLEIWLPKPVIKSVDMRGASLGMRLNSKGLEYEQRHTPHFQRKPRRAVPRVRNVNIEKHKLAVVSYDTPSFRIKLWYSETRGVGGDSRCALPTTHKGRHTVKPFGPLGHAHTITQRPERVESITTSIKPVHVPKCPNEPA